LPLDFVDGEHVWLLRVEEVDHFRDPRRRLLVAKVLDVPSSKAFAAAVSVPRAETLLRTRAPCNPASYFERVTAPWRTAAAPPANLD
jgi:hypothetical protein